MDAAEQWRWGLWRRPVTAVVDVALALLLLTLAVLGRVRHIGGASVLADVLTVVGCAGTVARHRFPTATLWVVGTAGVVATSLADDGVGLVPVAIVVGTVIAEGRRRQGIVAAAAVAIGLELALLLRGTDLGDNAYELSAVPLVLALAVAIGLAVDYRRRGIQVILDRARQAEETRDAEARRAVAEERVRIARELHDVVAHHVAVVGVQAATAEHLVTVDPEAARTAITQVRESSNAVLRELATLLDLLRGSGEDSRAPAPTLGRIDDLLDGLRRAGLDVEVDLVGEPHELAPVVDMAAYRLAQESLTNAHKHGDGSARFRLEYQGRHVVIEVRNGLGADTTGSGGYGLIGMTERATAVGGTLQSGVVDGEFVLRAELPDVRASGDPEEKR